MPESHLCIIYLIIKTICRLTGFNMEIEPNDLFVCPTSLVPGGVTTLTSHVCLAEHT